MTETRSETGVAGISAEHLLRFGLVMSAVLTWNGASHLWESGDTVGHLRSEILMLLTWGVSFALLGLAVLRSPPSRTVWAIPAALLLVLADYSQVHHVNQVANGLVVTTDLRLFLDYAARLILNGENPYTHDLRPGFELHRATLEYYTPLLDADYTGRLAYPALSPLVFTIFLALGLPSTVIFPFFLVVTVLTLFVAAPARYRPLVLLPLFAEERYLFYTFGGVSDIVWAWLLVMVVATWDRRTQRGIWFGLACAFKHQPWLLAPFFLVRLWHETEGDARTKLREMAVFTGWSVASFALVNLPFVLADPVAWFLGVTEPVGRPMITLGQGLSSLAVLGHVVYPKALYTVGMLAVLFIGLYVYYRHFHRLVAWMWVVPGVALWFGNRSLTSYWYYYAIPLVLALVTHWARTDDQPLPATPQRSWRPTIGLVVVFLAVLVGVTAKVGSQPAPLEVEVLQPIFVRGEWAREMTVRATNRSDETVTPRFAVQSWTGQPFFWSVAAGPLTLEAGQTGTYQVYTEVPFEMFQTRYGARVTASDTRRFDLRGTAAVPPSVDHMYAAVVPNGAFHFWSSYPFRPERWGITTIPEGEGGVDIVRDGPLKGGLKLWLPPSEYKGERTVYLNTPILLPDRPLRLRVLPPSGSNQWPDTRFTYGLRIKTEQASVRVLFGDTTFGGQAEDGEYYWVVPVLREGWQTVDVDVVAILDELGLTPSALRENNRPFPSLDFPMASVNLQLFVRVVDWPHAVEAVFGEIASTSLTPDYDALFARSLTEPERWLLWQGDYNLEQRNYDTAAELYREVLALDPTNGPAWYRLGEAMFWLDDCRQASEAYLRSVELGHQRGMAMRGIGWCHFNAGRMDFAASSFESSVDRLEQDGNADTGALADAHRGRALAYRMLGACDEFDEAATAARRLNPWIDLEDARYGPCIDRGDNLDVAPMPFDPPETFDRVDPVIDPEEP